MDILSVEFSGGGGLESPLTDAVSDERAVTFAELGSYLDVLSFLVDRLHRLSLFLYCSHSAYFAGSFGCPSRAFGGG